MKLEDLVIEQWNESAIDTTSVPRHLTFGKLVYKKAIEDACRVICFHCRGEVSVESRGGDWFHVFYTEEGRRANMIEICKASSIRRMLKEYNDAS